MSTQPPPRRRFRSSTDRIIGVDAARGIAILGMFIVHVLPTTDPFTGEASWAGTLFAGRSAALFAVLAGVGLALISANTQQAQRGGAQQPPHAAHQQAPANALQQQRRRIAIRAALIIGIGLTISLWPAGVAIILVHYGILFFCALPFLSWGWKRLSALALGWLALAPVAYFVLQHALRPAAAESAPRLWHSPSWLDLSTPGLLGLDLTVTGYYPLLLWPAYIFAGMAIGRLPLRRPAVAWGLLCGGAALAWLSLLVGRITLWMSGLTDDLAQAASLDPAMVRGSLTAGTHMLPIVTDPRWFLIATPHQGSPVDLVHTIATSAMLLGACLLLARYCAPLLLPLRGAGAMPLSLYVGHLLILGFWRPENAPLSAISPETMTAILLISALAAGAVKVVVDRRGPLEALIGDISAPRSTGG